MRHRISTLILCCSFALVSAAGAVPSGFDLRGTDPLKLLEILKRDVGFDSVLSIGEPVENWVREKDLPQLIFLLDSPELCAPVANIRSSFIPDRSTVGEQAAFLIQGFRAGIYPPDLHSGRMAPGVKDEIRAWWAARKR